MESQRTAAGYPAPTAGVRPDCDDALCRELVRCAHALRHDTGSPARIAARLGVTVERLLTVAAHLGRVDPDWLVRRAT